MKKTKILSLILAIVLLSTLCLFTTKTYATEADEKDMILTTTAEEDEDPVLTIGENTEETEETPDVHEGDLYVLFGEDEKTATKYVMDKLVDGNVYIMGNEVEISGYIRGNVFVMATKLTITEDAYIGMTLFACAQEITMSGYAFDVYAACGNFDMTNTGVAYRDLKLLTNDAHLIGAVGRDVDMGASNIIVYDDEENSFFVGRNLNYSSEKEIENIDKITIYGEVKYEESTEEEENTNVVLDFIFDAVQSIIFILVIYAAFLFLAPKFVEKSREYMSTRALLAGAIGLAFTILIPIVAFILLFTVVGVSLAFLCGFIYAVVLMISTAVVTIVINEFVCNKFEKLNSKWMRWLMLAATALVLFLIEQIPYLGGLVSVLVFFIGVGIITLYQFDRRRKDKNTNINITE